ncbi:hypothetical protein VPH35_038675 [Triticum aestivum]
MQTGSSTELQEQGARVGSWLAFAYSFSPFPHSRLPFFSWVRASAAGAPRGVEGRIHVMTRAAGARSLLSRSLSVVEDFLKKKDEGQIEEEFGSKVLRRCL